ncbi:MAG: hypothetical protein ACYCO9_17855 [Streptosporangiaceae bacterium]
MAKARAPVIRRTPDGFGVWADEYVRNEARAGSPAGVLRRLIGDGIRGLPGSGDRMLHAAYAGWRWSGTDVENLLFNNIDQGLSLFAGPGRAGVRFEDLGEQVPPGPDGSAWRCFYRYRLAGAEEPLDVVLPGDLVCRVPEVVVPDGPARFAARVWFAVCSARLRSGEKAGNLAAGPYVLRMTVRGLNPASSLKALVDGASAAMQRDEPGRLGEAVARLSRLLDADPGYLMALASDPGAPLGTRSRSGPDSVETLFTLDGAAQVRVTPDDDRCAAAEAVSAGDSRQQSVTLEVLRAEQRPQIEPWQAAT